MRRFRPACFWQKFGLMVLLVAHSDFGLLVADRGHFGRTVFPELVQPADLPDVHPVHDGFSDPLRRYLELVCRTFRLRQPGVLPRLVERSVLRRVQPQVESACAPILVQARVPRSDYGGLFEAESSLHHVLFLCLLPRDNPGGSVPNDHAVPVRDDDVPVSAYYDSEVHAR